MYTNMFLDMLYYLYRLYIYLYSLEYYLEMC